MSTTIQMFPAPGIFAPLRFDLPICCVMLALILIGHLRPSTVQAAAVGAEVPWTSYQAENGTTTGQKLAARTPGQIANEAVGRACVKLAATGQFVEWKVAKPANAIVIRFCMPDAPGGGGLTNTLSLAVNGKARQKLTVSSHHAWLYGKDANPQNDSPSAGPPHVFFDETRALLEGAPLQPGDTLRVFKDTGDTAPWYVIDLVDLETVEPPAKPPGGFLSVTDFGARPDDGKDDSTALKACAEKARAEGKGVWLPPGMFHQSQFLTVDSVKLHGAGPWHTRLTAAPQSSTTSSGGTIGFRMAGKDVEISDLAVHGTITARTGARQHGLMGAAIGFLIENVWVEHTVTGGWVSGTNGIVRRCRFRSTYADGLNVQNNANTVLVEHNHSRGNGDDGFAIFASPDHGGANGPTKNVILRHNTSEAQWWGNGIAVAGGNGHVVEQNLIESANSCAGIAVSSDFKCWPLNGLRVSGNILSNCGGNAFKQPWSGLQIYLPGESLKGLMVLNNIIQRSTYDGVKIAGTHPRNVLQASLIGNRIEAPGGNGIVVHVATLGSLTLKGNLASGLPPQKQEFINGAPPAKLRVTRN